MSETSPNLSLPYLQPSQAQKHVTHNEALRYLDTLVQLAVIDRDRAGPPVSSLQDDRHIVAFDPIGLWTGHAGEIAYYDQDTWVFYTPQPGWQAQVLDEGTAVVFDGTDWIVPVPILQNLDGVGIGTSSDATNRFALSSEASLFNHDGAGHQIKVNKALPADTSSLLFQTGFSGRAEMGTAGTDDFVIKVSSEGSVWSEALRVEASTGRLSAPSGGMREMLSAARSYFVNPTTGNDTNSGLTSVVPFATIDRAIAAAYSIDGGGHVIKIELADGTYGLSAPIALEMTVAGAPWLEIVGNVTSPDQVVITAAGNLFELENTSLCLSGMRLECTGSNGYLIDAADGSRVQVDQVVFGASDLGQIELRNASYLVQGDYEIDGDAEFHVRASEASVVRCDGHQVTLTGTPDFGKQFITCTDNSVANLLNLTFVGSATGKRYGVTLGGLLNTGTGSETYLPGDTNGSTASGGLYK